jgi:hypothetical protein
MRHYSRLQEPEIHWKYSKYISDTHMISRVSPFVN